MHTELTVLRARSFEAATFQPKLFDRVNIP